MKENKSRKDYFQGKYRVASARLSGWDYRNRACYFVTICTHNMIPAFGAILNGKMELNDLGQFANDSIDGINKNKENVKVLNHVVMPNHVHLLVYLTNNTDHKESNRFGPLIKGSLSSLLNHFKARITKHANNKSLFWPGWHERFHDHIVRSEASYEKINQYISDNPLNSNSDRYFR